MGSASAGGIAAVVLNYWKYMDAKEYSFDIALYTEPGMLGQKLISMGARCFKLPPKHLGIKAHCDALRALLTEHHYDAVHVHGADTAYVSLRVAKRCGVKIRIAHSHSAAKNKTLNQRLRLAASAILNPIYATDLLACGRLAGERCYGKLNTKRKMFTVLPNAIDTERFAFDPAARERVRRELGVSDKYVIGMVGRLSPQKNIPFALNVIRALHERVPDSALLVVGVGEQQKELERTIEENSMADYVRLLGKHADVENYYQAFDLLLMPSLYEGFPVVGVEAMASGLPIVLSDTITDELNFGDDVYFLPLGNAAQWATLLQELRPKTDPALRTQRQRRVKENGFEIRDAAKKLEAIYSSKE